MLTQQNKVGTPEYFMAAGEYAERENTRKEQQAKQADQPPVINRLIASAAQETAMNRGVAAIPAKNVGDYAPGGIVAFEDGGSVPRYQGSSGSVVQSPIGRRGFTFFDIQNIAPTIQSSFESMFSKEDLEATRLREQIRQLLGGKGGPYGAFKPQSDVEFAKNRELQSRLYSMPIDELRQTLNSLSATGSAPTAAATSTEPFRQGTQGDVRKADIAAGGAYSPSAPPQTTPYIPRTMQLSNVAAAPAAATLESALAEAEGIVSPKGSRTLTAAERLDEMKEYMKAAGFDADKFYKEQREDLEKKKAETKEDRREAANMRLIEAGLGVLGGESPFAFVNIGKGASPALKGFADDIKDIRKLTREYDKAIRDINVAEQSGKREMGLAALKRSQELSDRLEERKYDLAGRIYTARTNKEIAGMPGAEERLIARFADPKFAELAERAYKARGAGRGGASAISDIIEDYAKNPAKLEMLKDMNPALYNYVKAQLAGMAIPSAVSSPTGKIRE
jgi:hypothetical protein